MYDYHNDLRATHAASLAVVGLAARPQAGLVLPGRLRRQHDRASSTTPATWSSSGSSIPAVAWVALVRPGAGAASSLTFVLHRHRLRCGCPGRASTGPRSSTTSSPRCRSSFLALAYFLAELWHGPSRRTWLLARVAAAVAHHRRAAAVADCGSRCAASPNASAVNPGTEVVRRAVASDLMVTDLQGLSACSWRSVARCCGESSRLDLRSDRAGVRRRGRAPQPRTEPLGRAAAGQLLAGVCSARSWLMIVRRPARERRCSRDALRRGRARPRGAAGAVAAGDRGLLRARRA